MTGGYRNETPRSTLNGLVLGRDGRRGERPAEGGAEREPAGRGGVIVQVR
jgi:hypothetical protein